MAFLPGLFSIMDMALVHQNLQLIILFIDENSTRLLSLGPESINQDGIRRARRINSNWRSKLVF